MEKVVFNINSILRPRKNTKVLAKEKPKNAVILCHGYGGDGKDISILARYWRAHLPDTIIICPDAPEKCAASPTGFQWFDLMDQTEDEIFGGLVFIRWTFETCASIILTKTGFSCQKV